MFIAYGQRYGHFTDYRRFYAVKVVIFQNVFAGRCWNTLLKYAQRSFFQQKKYEAADYIQITYRLHTDYIQITYRLHTDYILGVG